MHSVTAPFMLFVLRKKVEDDHDFRLKTSDWMASEANPSPHMGHKCVGAAVLVGFALALRAACFLCASAVRRYRAKKVVSDSPGLVDFAIGLVIFVLNLPNGQVLFFGEIQITEGL